MFLSKAVKYICLTGEIKKLNLLAAFEYRLNFFLQILIGGIVDFAFFLLWMLFFDSFTSVKGWTFQDTALHLSIAWLGWSLVDIIAGGSHKIAKRINLGYIDYYLLLPQNVLWNISVNRMETSSIGTFFVSFVMFSYSGNITAAKCALFIGMSILSALILYNFIVIVQSIAFYIGNFELPAHEILLALVNLFYFPFSVFSGLLKYITMSIIPAYFICTAPAFLVESFNWQLFGSVIIFWFISFIMAIKLFYSGLKLYESANLVQVNV